MKKHCIGFKDNHVINSKETIKQILALKKYKLNISDENGNNLSWDDLDNSKHKESLFCNIVRDRRMRVDKGNIMADRPPYCVAYTDENEVVRIEYYEGHDELIQIYDIRRNDLYGEILESDMKKDAQRFDISKNLVEYFLQSLTNDIHSRIIKRPEHSKIRYYGRLSETLIEHQENLRFAIDSCLNM